MGDQRTLIADQDLIELNIDCKDKRQSLSDPVYVSISCHHNDG